MTNKSPVRYSIQADPSNILNNNKNNKSMFTPDINNMKQDLIFFKNDILKDLRQIEEKLNLKLTQQSLISQEQYGAYEKKLDLLSTKITNIDTMVTDNTNVNNKLNNFQIFKSKTENDLFMLNSRLMNIQKESKDSIIKIEKMFDENMRYPGVIGKKAKFPNLRFFVEFVINNIKLLNEFKDEFKNYDVINFKKKINIDIEDLRFVINDNSKNMRKLIEKNIQDFDSKLNDFNKNNDNKFKDFEDIIDDFKNKINDYLSQNINYIENKFNNLENNFSEKYNEQIKEINNLKSITNKSINDIDDIKQNFIKTVKMFDNIRNNYDKNLLLAKINKNNNISENNKFYRENKDNAQMKKLLFKKKKESRLTIAIKNIGNKNIKIYGNNIQHTEKTKSENTLECFTNMRMKNINIIEHSKSFDKSQNNKMNLKNLYSDEKNEFGCNKECFDFSQDLSIERDKINSIINLDSKNSVPNNTLNLNKHTNYKNGIFHNNYSVVNIPDIKIKKVILPESLNYRNKYIKMSRSSQLNTKGKSFLTNNLSITKKYILKNSENNTISRNTGSNFNVTKIIKHKNSRMKGFKSIQSAKIINGRQNSVRSDNLNSFIVVKTKNKDNILNSANNLRKNKNRNLSFEKNKKENVKVQIDSRNNNNIKNKFKELLLVNAKNLRKNRTVKM